jgi:hypothetical protein
LELFGAIWSHLKLSGDIWSCLEPSGAIWDIQSYLELSGAYLEPLELSAAIF